MKPHTTALGLASVLALTLACATARHGDSNEALEARADALEAALRGQPLPPLEPGALRVRLAFGEDVDLDLFVTDPSHESVYFANKTSRTGGTLSEDLRCDAPAPRIEAVTLRQPPPGRYRVGVDFPKHCGEPRERAALVVAVEAPRSDGRRELLVERRAISLEVFEPIVLEFDLP